MVRNFGLDILRAFSIWLVLLQHGGINIPGLSPLKIGGIGVEIFFVLSGFLIGGILFRELDKGHSLPKTLKNFWTRRWLRILPLYYAVLSFKFIFIDHSIGRNILYYFLFLQNNFYGISFLDVSWSLVIEEWFYIFSPIFIFILFRLMNSDRNIFISMLMFILFVIIARSTYAIIYNISYQGINSAFPFRFDSLFLGVCFAFLKYKEWKLFEKLSSPLAFTLGLTIVICYIYYYWTLAYPNNLINQSWLPRTLGFFILPFGISLTIPFISKIQFDQNKNTLNKSFFLFINTTSILTYSIYLIHPFIFLLHWNLGLSILVTYLISWITYNYFEKPILNYRDRITLMKVP